MKLEKILPYLKKGRIAISGGVRYKLLDNDLMIETDKDTWRKSVLTPIEAIETDFELEEIPIMTLFDKRISENDIINHDNRDLNREWIQAKDVKISLRKILQKSNMSKRAEKVFKDEVGRFV